MPPKIIRVRNREAVIAVPLGMINWNKNLKIQLRKIIQTKSGELTIHRFIFK